MADGMEAVYENKIKVKDVDIEKLQTIEADAVAHADVLTKDECNKEIEKRKTRQEC